MRASPFPAPDSQLPGLPVSPASPASSRCPGHLPVSGSVLCRKGPRAPPWPHVAKGTEASPRSRCAPPLCPHPDMGNKVQRRQKNDTQADEGGHRARCRPWPTEPELSLCLVSQLSQVLLTEEGMRGLNPRPELACGTPLNLCLFF